MKKVIVVGCSGSGKSTFCRKLRDKIDLPLFYLDMIWHKPDKTTVSQEEFDNKLNELLKLDEWIIDGNYMRTLDLRMSKCDTVILFDLPIDDCLKGVEQRIGTKREDMPWIEEEFDSEFKEWITNFPNIQTPYTYELINKYKGAIDVVIFKTRKQADDYLNNL